MTQLLEAKLLHHVWDGYHMLPLPGVVLHPALEARASVGELVSAWKSSYQWQVAWSWSSSWLVPGYILRWIERSDPFRQGSVVEAKASLGTVVLWCVYSLYLYPAWCLTASLSPRSWSWSGQRPAWTWRPRGGGASSCCTCPQLGPRCLPRSEILELVTCTISLFHSCHNLHCKYPVYGQLLLKSCGKVFH